MTEDAVIQISCGNIGYHLSKHLLPDNLTNFKLRAKAASGPDRFGVGTGQVSVRLPVIVQPALPRFVRPVDRFTAAAIGRIVEGPGGAATAELRTKGIEVTGSLRRNLDLKLNQPQLIEYQVVVPTPPASARGEVSYAKVGFTVAVERTADKARDGFDVQLSVRPVCVKLTQRQLIELKPGQAAELPEVAEAARAGSLRRSLVASD
ncbi:MAG: alpha-2-macroglobulin family protein [Sulfuricella sp.]